MPNTPDNELSALLHKAEPPQSPAHLDEAILAYAREHVPATAAKHSFFGDMRWMQRNWVSAAATFSVAAIAISVSLQFFTDPELPRATAGSRTQELALGSARALELADEEAKVAEREEIFPQAPAPPASSPVQEARQQQELFVIDTADSPASAAPLIAADAAGGVTARRNSNEIDTSTQSLQNLASILPADSALQETVIITLRRALGTREQNSVVRRGSFPEEIRPYIETYRGLRDAVILANVQNRFSVARADLLETRLPESIEELVTLLETL